MEKQYKASIDKATALDFAIRDGQHKLESGYEINGKPLYDQVGDHRQKPAYGPYQIQKSQIGVQREDSINPRKPEQAYEQQGGYGGHYRLAQASEHAAHQLIYARDKVGDGRDYHFLPGIGDDGGG